MQKAIRLALGHPLQNVLLQVYISSLCDNYLKLSLQDSAFWEGCLPPSPPFLKKGGKFILVHHLEVKSSLKALPGESSSFVLVSVRVKTYLLIC